MKQKPKEYKKVRVKRGDRVLVTTGKDKGKEGKVLAIHHETGRVVVEGVNMIKRHQKVNQQHPQGGIIRKEAPVDASNVMYVFKGKPTRIGYKVERKEINGKFVNVKYRVAVTTGDVID